MRQGFTDGMCSGSHRKRISTRRPRDSQVSPKSRKYSSAPVSTGASDCKTYPFQATANGQTRALVTADFNDPNLFWQWHYINNADQAVATTSVAGADINVADAWKTLSC